MGVTKQASFAGFSREARVSIKITKQLINEWTVFVLTGGSFHNTERRFPPTSPPAHVISTLSEHMLLFIKLLFTIGRIDSSLTFSVADLHLAKHFLQGRVAPRQELIQQCTNISATQ